MDSENKEDLKVYHIPPNITSTKRILNFRLRNIIEAAIVSVAIRLAFMLLNAAVIHFVPKVEYIVTGGLIVLFGGISLFGIKGMSISEIIINLTLSGKTKHKYRFRTVDKSKRKESDAININTNVRLNESYFEKALRIVKKKFREFKGS